MACKSWLSQEYQGILCDANKSNCHLCGNCRGEYSIIYYDNMEVEENDTLYVSYDINLVLRILDEMIPNGIKNSVGYEKAKKVCKEESGFFPTVLLDHIRMYNTFNEQIILIEFVHQHEVVGYGVYSY